MKTVMKKLLSLALVAILLVSAVPFQAHADGNDPIEVPITVDLDGKKYDKGTLSVTADITLDEALARTFISKEGRTFVEWESTSGKHFQSAVLTYDWLKTQEGYSLTAYFTATAEKPTEPAQPTEPAKPTEPAQPTEPEKPTEHTHDFKVVSTTPATCEKDGKEISRCACGAEDTKTLTATGHKMGEWTLNDGKNVRSCQNAGCDYTESQALVKFVDGDITVETVSISKGAVFGTLPTPTKKTGYDFIGWYSKPNGAGTRLQSSTAWDGDTFTYYAYFQENADGTKDGLSYLTIRMRTYTGSTQTNDVLLDKVEMDDDTNVLQWLNNNEKRISDAIFNKVDSTKYEWLDRVYYNNDTKAELTSQATLADGDKVVFVKVHAVASTETNVQLYIHKYDSTNKVYNTLKIVDVGGYKTGDTITLTKMATVVKKYYSYTSIKGLYTDTTWKQMVGGQNPTASSSITVSGNGTVKYHVLLNGASAASSTSNSTADKTNPKTGDMIMVPVMVMVASAAAAAFVYMNSKKRAVR